MLLNFTCDNFKSFREGFDFNMTPAKRMTDLSYSILKETVPGGVQTGLPTSVVYGPNAAGKTSVVDAMSCMRQIVLRGNIRDVTNGHSGSHVSGGLSLAPCAFRGDAAPVGFDVSFTHNGMKYRYVLSAFLGGFLERNVERHIDRERLFVNDSLVFERTKDAVDELRLDAIASYLNVGYELKDSEKTRRAMSDNMDHESLLLVSDFNSFCSKRLVSEIRTWFEEQLIVVNSADVTRLHPGMYGDDGCALTNAYINRVTQEAGAIGSDLVSVSDPETHATRLMSYLQKTEGTVSGLDADGIESAGTMRLISIMPLIISALRRGAVLVMDDLDSSLHPMAVMSLINVFHNDGVNKRGAQLIFNTHNPIYLGYNLFRRDEIKFVERDRESKSSSLYALSDFRTNGRASVRKTDDYMMGYLMFRYGAIEDVDVTDIIQDVLKGDEGTDWEGVESLPHLCS